MTHILTRHAQARMQQRGIPVEALDCLLDFGREAFDHHGGVVLYFDKAARRQLSRATSATKNIDRVSRCYAVLLEGKVVTVGHRYRRINRA